MTKQRKKTEKDIQRGISEITDAVLAGLGAVVTTDIGAGLLGALKA